jgi:hypothetical protein
MEDEVEEGWEHLLHVEGDKKCNKMLVEYLKTRRHTWENNMKVKVLNVPPFSVRPSLCTIMYEYVRICTNVYALGLPSSRTVGSSEPGDRLCVLVVRVPGYTIRYTGFDSGGYQIFWELLSLERGPLSLVSITEELLEWKSSGSGPRKIEIKGHGVPLRWPRYTLYPRKLALTSPTSGGRSVGIFCLLTKATENLV